MIDPLAPLVLVVDRDDRDRTRFCAELAEHGYQTICSPTIRGAVGHLEQVPAVVVFCLDVDASRHAKLQFVDALPRGATLILSGASAETVVDLELTTIPFLEKPFGVEAFVAKVVESSRVRREQR